MDMPSPTPGHARFSKLAGNWKGEEKMHPSQWDPKGGIAVGKMNSRIDLSGFAMISDYVQERDGQTTFAGHSVTTYEPKEDLYTMHWFDCMGSPPEVFTGKFSGDTLVVGHGGPGMHARMTYDLSDPAKMVSKMEMSQDGREWKTLFDGTYTRS